MPMEGSSEEYEKLTLASLKKAASPDSDATYHNNRAAIFSSLAMAAASAEMAEAIKHLAGLPSALGATSASGSSPVPARSGAAAGDGHPSAPPAPRERAAAPETPTAPPADGTLDPESRGLPAPSPVVELFKTESG